METFFNTYQNRRGRPVDGVTVTVVDQATSMPATLFETDGTTAKANPFSTGPNGELAFQAADGQYDIEFSGLGTGTIEGIVLNDTAFPVGDVRNFGSISPDAATAFQAAIDQITTTGGEVILPEGTIDIGSTVTNKDNVTIRGAGRGKTTIRATSSMTNMLTSVDATNIGYCDFTLDGNDNVTSILLNSTAPNGLQIDRLNVTSWSTGILVISGTTAAQNVWINDVFMSGPAAVSAGNPLRVASGVGGLRPTNVNVTRTTIIGVGGDFTPTNSSTADQFAFQGVEQGNMTNCISRDGGENGFTIARLCRDITLTGCIAIGNDKHGFGLGSGLVSIIVADSSNFAVDDTLTQQPPASAATGTIQYIDGATDEVWVNSVTGGKLVEGATVSDGSDTSTITSVIPNQRISAVGCISVNNGLDAAAGGGTLVGFFTQQTDHVSLVGCQAYDDQATQTQDYGLQMNQSEHILISGSTFNNNQAGPTQFVGEYSLESVMMGAIHFPDAGNLVIDAGEVTIRGGRHRVDTEGAAGTDDLDTIKGGIDGQMLVLRTATEARDVVIKHGTGNISLAGGTDFTLAATRYKAWLFNEGGDGDTVDGEWFEFNTIAVGA